ncbi:MAG: flagellar motor protein [Armatimonadetes bacterium]|nr:flagellar motor protein [Armatimonadota bacterium]
MDLATIIGLIVAWAAVIVGLLLDGGSIGGLLHPSSAILVFGGSLGASMIGFSLQQTLKMPRATLCAFMQPRLGDVELVNRVVELAHKARREGILALESDAAALSNPFLRRGIQLVVDGMPSETVREILETEIEAMRSRHRTAEQFYSTMGGFAPTMGIIGTVLGLVHMLHRLDVPGKMGPAIAAAFTATLYGVSVANLLFLPLSTKLRSASQTEAEVYRMLIEGILSLQAGEHPQLVEARMAAFLSAGARHTLQKSRRK